jgi:hypothetical protein
VSVKPPKNNWPLALARHVTYASAIEWPEYTKQKRAFGMPEESAWYTFLLSPHQLDAIVMQTKKSAEWFFRYANAKTSWTFKIVDLESIVNNKVTCEIMSAHCIRDFLQKRTNTETSDFLTDEAPKPLNDGT